MAQNVVIELEIPPHRNATLMTSMNIRLEFLPAKVATIALPILVLLLSFGTQAANAAGKRRGQTLE